MRAMACVKWTRWLVRTLLASSYPGAPYERKYMALDLLNAVAETWGVGGGGGGAESSSSGGDNVGAGAGAGAKAIVEIDAASEAAAATLEASPYAPCLGSDCTTSLLGRATQCPLFSSS